MKPLALIVAVGEVARVDGGGAVGPGVVAVAALERAALAQAVIPDTTAPRSAATTGGLVGELHPSLLEGEWSGFELFLDELAEFLRRQPEARAEYRTGSGLPVQRLYTPADIAKLKESRIL